MLQTLIDSKDVAREIYRLASGQRWALSEFAAVLAVDTSKPVGRRKK